MVEGSDLAVAEREPELVDDPLFDHEWRANPVGAIVLATPDGDSLVHNGATLQFEIVYDAGFPNLTRNTVK